MAEPVTTSAAIMAGAGQVVAPAVRTTLEYLGKALAKPIANLTRGVIDKAIVDLRIGFQQYLNNSYSRCRHYKTILNPNQPIEIRSNYLNITMSSGKNSVEDTAIIDNLQTYRRVVVTGLAGIGKSMFMKYLTISRSYSPNQLAGTLYR
jgi:hypothetical protein